MKHKFPRTNQQQKDICPSGYVWITNISMENKYSIDATFGRQDSRSFFQKTKDTYRKLYGDVMVISPAYTIAGIENDGSVALYVPHPAIRRITKWLRNHNKMKGGNLPY